MPQKCQKQAEAKRDGVINQQNNNIDEECHATFQTFPGISLLAKLIRKLHRPQNKTFTRGTSPDLPVTYCFFIWIISLKNVL